MIPMMQKDIDSLRQKIDLANKQVLEYKTEVPSLHVTIADLENELNHLARSRDLFKQETERLKSAMQQR